MSNKPVQKRKAAVRLVSKAANMILFNATEEAAAEFESFGEMELVRNVSGYYSLFVDARYDFDEVLAFIEAYG